MDANGRETDSDARVLHWQSRVVTAEDLRLRLNGQKEIVLPERAIITPLAAEQLSDRGVRIVREKREQEATRAEGTARWAFVEQRPVPVVKAALTALERDGMPLRELDGQPAEPACRWAVALAQRVANAEVAGLVVFCDDPGLVCCVANRIRGVRGAAIYAVNHAVRAALSLSANFIGIEMPGRTLFELRQMLRTLCSRRTACPEPIATTLKELDGDAHR